jgi:hypothetical protein
MFVIEFALCLALNECIAPIVDVPRTRHKTQEECMSVAYIKALELYALNERPDLTIKYICLSENEKEKV